MNIRFRGLYRVRNLRLKKLGFISYPAYLASDLWLSRRARFAEGHPAVCAQCQGQAHAVHHVTYERLGNEDDADLCWLCEECHDEVHQFGGLYPPTAKQVEQLHRFGVDPAVIQRLTMNRAYRLIDDIYNCRRPSPSQPSAGV